MKLLQINISCGVGGIGRQVTDLHALLLSQGHQSCVGFGRFAARNCSQAIRIGSRFDNYLHVARTRLLDGHGFGSAGATRAFVERIRAWQPEVVHLHNLHGYYLHVGVLFEYLKKLNKRVIWTLRDCWTFTGHCSHFDFIGCDRWKTGCHHCPLRSEYPKSIFLDRSERNYRRKRELFTGLRDLTIVTPSKWLAKLVTQSFLRDYPVTVINNGFDLTMFRPAPSDFRKRYGLENQFILLGVAFTWEGKGLPYFTELAKHLPPGETIVLVGLPERQIMQLPPGIIGIRRTDSTRELAQIYSAADVFINPTLEDTFPSTNLEALACGTPVVTFDSGGSPECVDASCGLVVERGNSASLLAAVARVRNLGKEFYTASCRKHVQNHFDKDQRLLDYLELYHGNLIGEHDREPQDLLKVS